MEDLVDIMGSYRKDMNRLPVNVFFREGEEFAQGENEYSKAAYAQVRNQRRFDNIDIKARAKEIRER